MSKFKVGDRFAYNNELRHEGKILKVNHLAGTVEVSYYDEKGNLRDHTHILAESKLINLTNPPQSNGYLTYTYRWQLPASTPEQVLGTPKPDKRTEQLLNELYHDRARLEKIVANAVEVVRGIKEYAEEIEHGAATTEGAAYVAGQIDQFLEQHG
jgi:hypothetical protein